jgi:rod shape-determining protein MreD
MISGTFQRLDRSTRQLVPFFSSVVLVMLSALPVYIPGYGQIAVDVGLMTVFYWAIYRPDLFPAIAAFVLGLWQDILVGSPMGLHALILLLVNWIIISQRKFFQGKSFAVIWWCFSLVSLASSLVSWMIICGLKATVVSPTPVFFQAALTIGVFPFMAWLLARAQHAVVRPLDE